MLHRSCAGPVFWRRKVWSALGDFKRLCEGLRLSALSFKGGCGVNLGIGQGLCCRVCRRRKFGCNVVAALVWFVVSGLKSAMIQRFWFEVGACESRCRELRMGSGDYCGVDVTDCKAD